MRRTIFIVFAAASLFTPAFGQGDATKGQRDFRACAACHSLEPNHNMTGPSLAELWGRKAGALASFDRYSDALKSSGIIWNDQTLDKWLADPQRLVPNNEMPFAGIKDASIRADLIAFLKQNRKSPQSQPEAKGGMMGGGSDPNLKAPVPQIQVKAITYCRDTYRVTTADGKTRAFWERNLRFKTDTSKDGPKNGAPAIMPAGMMGDRASVIFSAPEEIAKFIERKC